MLATLGVLLIGAGYLVLRFAYLVCRHRPNSIWASEVSVLAVLGPALMMLFAAGAAFLVTFWLDGGLQLLSSTETAMTAAAVVVIAFFSHLAGLRLRRMDNTPA